MERKKFLCLLRLVAVLQRNDAVEHGERVRGILVLAEVAHAQELEAVADLLLPQIRLGKAVNDLQRIPDSRRAMESFAGAAFSSSPSSSPSAGAASRLVITHQHVIQATLKRHVLLGTDPVNRALDLAIRALGADLLVKSTEQ